MRIPEWERGFYAEIKRYSSGRYKFEYGVHDCALFTARLIDAQTDLNLFNQWSSRYDDRHGAARLIRENGGTLEKLVSAALRRVTRPARLAHRGDPVIISPTRGPLGICDGTGALFVTARGLRRRTLGQCSYSWTL